MSAGTRYLCRLMDARAQRDTYPLALLHHPGLTLSEWRSRIRKLLAENEDLHLIAIYNARACAVAVVRQWPAGLDFLLRPPGLLADPGQILATVRDTFGV